MLEAPSYNNFLPELVTRRNLSEQMNELKTPFLINF